MPTKRSLSGILEMFRQQIVLLTLSKTDLTMKDSHKLTTEQRLRKLQDSLKGSGALKVLVDERQKEMG